MEIRKILIIALIALGVGIGATVYVMGVYFPHEVEYDQQIEEVVVPEQDAWKKSTRESEEFQNKINDELDRMYWLEMQEKSNENLLKLQDKGFTGETAQAVRKFLNEQDSDLAMYANEIVKLPRWVEALAIAGKETNFCNAGVGNSKNNCGAIKNSKTGEFKIYASQMDAVEDISFLLQKDLYKDKTIAEMNGTYCVYEEGPTGLGPCPNWTEVVEHFISEIHLSML